MRFWFPPMKERHTAPELMDIPDSDITLLSNTLIQFKLLNALYTASRFLIKERLFSIMEKDPTRPYTLLDIGAGGCDIDVWMIQKARKKGITLSVTAIDYDERIRTIAEDNIAPYQEIKLVIADAEEIGSLGTFDFIFSNHFLHHLDWNTITTVLKQVDKQATMAFFMNDIQRSIWPYIGYSVFVGIFCRKSFAFHDGRLSILKGFTYEEWKEFIEKQLPDSSIQIIKAFPARIVLFKKK